jgi:hypothetical protein
MTRIELAKSCRVYDGLLSVFAWLPILESGQWEILTICAQ